MKEMFKLSGGIFLKNILVTVMAAFVCISFSVLCTAAFKGKEIGYTASVTDSSGNIVEQAYNHYYSDGDDLIKSKYADKIEKGEYTFATQPLNDISKAGKIVFATVPQIIIILMLFAFIYSKLWLLGTKDENAVRFGHKEGDKFYGLKVGIIADIPYILLYLWLFAAFALRKSFGLASAVYVIGNYHFWPILNVVFGDATKVSQYWQFAIMFLLLLVVPAISYVSYLLGYKQISISERLTYKKKKGNK